MEDYEAQIRDLRDQLNNMEDAVRKKDDEITSILDGERSRATAANLEKKEWNDARGNMENQLADARNLADSLRDEIDRERDDHAAETRQLREQMEDLRRAADKSMSNRGGGGGGGGGGGDPNMERENQELRTALREQQQVTDEVRREAEEFLREMRMLSQQSGSAFERQADMEKTIESLEQEVRDWRNRYARTKTQLRNMRATSMGLAIEQDAGKYVRERGFTTENGMVKDVHVTKFQISIDELLRRARVEEPDKAIDSMKAVVVNVRRITKDIDESTPNDEALIQQQVKLKAKVSTTANNLITAAKNFGNSAGISPVSLLDAAASHLVAAVVELLRTVKIRATPAGELEDDDDGTMTPVDSTGFFSPRSNGQTTSTTVSTEASLPPPRPFQGLGGGAGNRDSADSSAYSPISSPRESVERYPPKRPTSRMNGANGNGGYLGVNKGLPQSPGGNGNMNGNGNGFGASRRGPDRRTEDLKVSPYPRYSRVGGGYLVNDVHRSIWTTRRPSWCRLSRAWSAPSAATRPSRGSRAKSATSPTSWARSSPRRSRAAMAGSRSTASSPAGSACSRPATAARTSRRTARVPATVSGACGRRRCPPSPSRSPARPRSWSSASTRSSCRTATTFHDGPGPRETIYPPTTWTYSRFPCCIPTVQITFDTPVTTTVSSNSF